MRRGLGVLTAFAATVAIVPAQPHPPRSWPTAFSECTVGGNGESARCGVVRVPESSGPQSRQIDIRVVVLPARAALPLTDPVVPLAGGPGQGAADLAGVHGRQLDVLRERRDILLVDQRGTASSNGLHCAANEPAAALFGHLFNPARLQQCRDDLSQRADLTRYTTPLAAADFARVWDALGYQRVNLIGTSYGSRMALELARQFPARIRTMTLDAVAPISLTWPSRAAPDADAALMTLVDDCKAEGPCARAFPSFAQDIDAAFARVSRGPVDATVRDPASGQMVRVRFGRTDLGYAVRGLLYGDAALRLPQWFKAAAAGSYDRFAQAYIDRARGLDREIADGVHLGVYCAEDLPRVDWPAATAAARATHLGTYLLDQYRAACAVWPRGALPSSYFEPVHSRVPTLLMTGRRDPVTPPRTATDAARTLEGSRLLLWRYGGHASDGLLQRGCRAAIVNAFIQSGSVANLPIGCMTSSPLPFPVDPQ
jgi:pimeloyl-ACP methyl ester carboxylesterase